MKNALIAAHAKMLIVILVKDKNAIIAVFLHQHLPVLLSIVVLVLDLDVMTAALHQLVKRSVVKLVKEMNALIAVPAKL